MVETDRERAFALFTKLEEMTCVMRGDPKAKDPDERDDVIEPMFDVLLDASTYRPTYEAVRAWRIRVKWSEAQGLGFIEGNDEFRCILDLADEANGQVRIENAALEIVL